MTDIFSHSHYHNDVFGGIDKLNPITKKARGVMLRAIKKNGFQNITHVAMRGVSGMVVGGAFCGRYKYNPIVIRKSRKDSHADTLVEGCPKYCDFNYVILDDFVGSGDTLKAIMREIAEQNPTANCLGVVCYHRFHTAFHTSEWIDEKLRDTEAKRNTGMYIEG